MADDELELLADPELQQHFLVSPDKLSLLFRAADVRPDDRVVEVGAGAGTVSRHMPPCTSLTVVELDERLIDILKEELPEATVLHGDALRAVREVPFDVLLGNLPHDVTESLIDMLPELSFRTAVLSVGESTSFDRLPPELTTTEITTTSGSDFIPPQPGVSRIVKVSRHRV